MSLATSSQSRERILAKIRSQQNRTGDTPQTEVSAVHEHIAKHESGPLPKMDWPDDAERFLEQCERLQTSHATLADISKLPAEIMRYMQDKNVGTALIGWDEFSLLDWNGASLNFQARTAKDLDTVGLTSCFCAIAETGTLLLLSSASTPKTVALLPETHICTVRKERIVKTMEDAFALMRKEIGQPPRSMFFVSGPSRTADIEQTIVIGAHGPYRVHVVVI
jgi:L-lactate dehydrogenase complex protein LldG